MAKRNDKDKKVFLIVAIAIVVLIAFVLVLSLAVTNFNFYGFEKQLAVIPIKGTILMEEDNFSGTLGALEIIEIIDKAENDPLVGAIFLDIDSPGGEIVATHQIVEKIREVEKPTIAYIASIGASGGYYVAAASDHVFADPFSVTGSIGALWMAPNIKDFLEDFGIKFNIVRSGKLKALPNFFEELDEEQEALIMELVTESFEQFKSDIILFRGEKINLEEFEKITDGRILSGKQALELNLVDELLTREKAILRAGEIAGIKEKPVLKEYGSKTISLFDLFSASGKAFASGFKSSLDFSNSGTIRT